MAANTLPLFGLTPNIGKCSSAGANVKSDGTGTIATDMAVLATAGANGTWISKVRFNAVASVAATATVNTVLRVYYSTQGSGATTNVNTFLLYELVVPATTADQTTAATFPLEIPFNFAIPSGTFLLFSQHAANIANTLWQAVSIGIDY